MKLRLRAWWHRCATVDQLAKINNMELLRSMATVRPRLLIKIYKGSGSIEEAASFSC